MDLHLGKLISEKVKEKNGLTQAELARQIGSSRQNLQSMLKRESMDSYWLYRISIALEFDLFDLLSKEMKKGKHFNSEEIKAKSKKSSKAKVKRK